MKKLFTSFVLCCAFAMGTQAQVYYLLPNSSGWNSQDVTNVYDNNSEPSQNQLQWEAYEWTAGNNDFSPERRAYEWFRESYCSGIADEKHEGVRRVITFKDLIDGRLAADGDLFPSVQVLWVNVDRKMSRANLDDLFPSDVRTALANYVKAGGNLYCSTFGVQVAHLIGRVPEPGFSENNAIGAGSDTWEVRADFGQDNHNHAVYKYLNAVKDLYNADSGNYPMQRGSNRTDRNCLWTVDYGDFQSNNNCRVLGSWGHGADKSFQSEGLVEFYPQGEWKGTIICNGLAACSFAPTNEYKSNVEALTRGILDYLSQRASIEWDVAPKDNPVIKEGEDVSVTVGVHSVKEVFGTSNSLIANIDAAGHIYYNHFGEVTFSASAAGDGTNIPKNKVTVSATRTVTGGAPATYAYVLPYSMETISTSKYEGEGEGTYLPDYMAAWWFYENYVKSGTGCFINPVDYSSDVALPSVIKVLWVNSDHVGLASNTYYSDLGGDKFRQALSAFISGGGNVFLSKQATRLLGDLGRLGKNNENNNIYPSYANGGYINNGDSWGIKNKFYNGEYNYSTHAVYKDLGENPEMIDGGTRAHRTDNNHLLFNADYEKPSFEAYQRENNCRLLGSWANGGEKYQSGVFAEFFPQRAGEGTIIEIGAAAYQWNNHGGVESLDNIHANIKTLTANILSYLASEPTLEWSAAPADGIIGQTATVTATGSGEPVISYSSSVDSIAAVNSSTGALAYSHFGRATITATADIGDGMSYPKRLGVSISTDIEVSGGNASAGYGYVLPYSLKTLQAYTVESNADATLGYPDYLAAKWFYEHYIAPERTSENNYGEGRFVAKNGIPSDNSATKVLWFNMDRAGYSLDDFNAEFIETDFNEHLKSYVQAGGNIFFTKQTTRLASDIRGGDTWYPTVFGNGGIASGEDKGKDWYMTVNFLLDGKDIDKSHYSMYKYMGDPITEDGRFGYRLLSTNNEESKRTDNNSIWDNWNGYKITAEQSTESRLTAFEQGIGNCRVLAGYGHTRALEAVGMLELLPQDNLKGTMIALGLAAYQWNTHNTASDKVKNLTRGVLEYLYDVDEEVIVQEEDTEIPNPVNKLVIYKGGSVSNTGDIDVNAIEYRMPVERLDQWSSLSLPFEVSAVQVWDEEDGAYYDLLPYYRTGGRFYSGHYIIRTPEAVRDFPIADFGNWNDPESPSGYKPSKNTPYIIQWHHDYFEGKTVSFFGGAQRIAGAHAANDAPSADDVVNVYGNNTLRSREVTDAYMLEGDYGSDGAWLREEMGTSRKVLPFECYVLAQAETAARYRILRREDVIETPTGWEEVSGRERKARISVYTVTGIPVASFSDCSYAEVAQRLDGNIYGGIYVLRSDNESVKLMLGGK